MSDPKEIKLALRERLHENILRVDFMLEAYPYLLAIPFMWRQQKRECERLLQDNDSILNKLTTLWDLELHGRRTKVAELREKINKL